MALSFFDTENRGRTILFAVTGAIFSAGLMAAMWVPVFISKTEDGPTLQKNYLDLCRVDKCGLTGPKFAERRIVRGRDALDDEFPYQVAFWSLLNPFVIFCSGNMINDRWVLTVAHCLEGRYIPYVRMSAGIMKVEEGWSNSIQILDYWIHPERVIKRNLHDIALIKTKQSIESASSHFVSPICLPFSDLTTTDSDRVSVAGFGLTSENGSGSDNLLAVNLQIQPNRNCRVYASFRPESMICAGDPENNADTCQGDSGSALAHRNRNGSYVVLAMTSFGAGCGQSNISAVYTRVYTYLEWTCGVLAKQGLN